MHASSFIQVAEQALQLEQAGHPDQAHPLWLQLHSMQPRHVEVLSSLGRVLLQMDRAAEALPYLQRALALQPQHLNSLLNMGVALQATGQYREALARYEQLLPLDARFARTALFNMGAVQQQLLDLNAACASYSKLLMLETTNLGAHAGLMFTLHYQWPVPHAHITQRARQFGQALAARTPAYTQWPRSDNTSRPLRVGLLSSDLFDHPVGYFLEGFLHTQATRRFEWVAYTGQRQDTALTERIRPCFSQWHAVRAWSDEALARQIHQDEVDVLVDLSGFTTGQRQGVLAYRPAPVQIGWLGYFGTTGMPFIDAVVADPHCVPDDEASWFTEPLLRLPHTRFCFTPPVDAPDIAPLPALRNGYLTFGCFQDLAKINDAVLAAWARVAQAVPTARFRLQRGRLEPGSPEREALLQRMAHAGLDTDRVDCVGELPRADYLAAYAQVDVLLDTFPYPGGTTTAEALWMGVPTHTLASPGMLGRQGQQIMSAADLPDWVCFDEDSYVQQACQWVQPDALTRLAALRSNMRHRLATSPLFDQDTFAHHWCEAVQTLAEHKRR